MADRPSIEERLAAARESSDLRHREARCDVDILHAAGTVEPAAACLQRLRYNNEPEEYRKAVDVVSRAIWHMDRRWRWRTKRHEREQLAEAVLRYWLAPNCRKCTGLQFRRAKDAPALDAKACPACRGTGDIGIRLPDGYPADPWYRRAQEALAWVQRTEARAVLEMAAKLR